MKTAIICDVGFDGGGTTKLGIEYSRLGLTVFMRDYVQPLQYKPNADTLKRIILYDNLVELQDRLSEYDRLIFLPFVYKATAAEPVFKTIANVVKSIGCKDVCYVFCSRKPDFIIELMDLQRRYQFWFNHYFSISPCIKKFVTNQTFMNVNAYTFHENQTVVSEADRKRIIFTAGRIEAVKGICAYFKSVDDKFLANDDFLYIHEGAKFSFSRNGSVHTTSQLLPLFNLKVSPKVVKPQFVFANYGETAQANKITIYPSYAVDMLPTVWPNYYAGICCILGTKHSVSYVKTLLGTDLFIEDRHERRRILNNLDYWSDALEYTTLEMIDFGIPVFMSRLYADLIGYDDKRLIYDTFGEIPMLVNGLSGQYMDALMCQRKFFIDKQTEVNSTIIKAFTTKCEGE